MPDTIAGEDKKRKASAPIPTEFIEIPKSLKLHPSDTPQDRLAKRRKIHAIKSKNRLLMLYVHFLFVVK